MVLFILLNLIIIMVTIYTYIDNIGKIGLYYILKIFTLVNLLLSLCILYICLFHSIKFNYTVGINYNSTELEITNNFSDIIILICINIISYIIFLYSQTYMYKNYLYGGKYLYSYNIYLLGFILSMIFLIFSSNCYNIIIGYDYLGIFSYFLVSYYNKKEKNSFVGLFINKIGDMALYITSVLLKELYGTYSLNLFNNANNVIIISLIFSVITKSAQFGFHNWLTLAMSGPTTVSSLLHSSTLVVAGIILVSKYNIINLGISNIKNNFLFMYSFLGFITILITSLINIIITDIKNLIALSTNSQIGLILIELSLNNDINSIYHVLNHGLIKSNIFLLVSFLINLNKYYQDIRAISNTDNVNSWLENSISLFFSILSGSNYSSIYLSKEWIYNLKLDTLNEYYLINIIISAVLTNLYSLL